MMSFFLQFSLIFPAFSAIDDIEDRNVELTHHTFNSLRYDNTEILNDFYAPEVKFIDPIGEINGLDEMKEYYKKMYEGIKDIKFIFKPHSVTDGRYFFPWDMYLTTPKLNSGEEFMVSGVSEIHFQGGLVTFHRDYFDMGDFIYERIPLLGRIIKMIKHRFEN